MTYPRDMVGYGRIPPDPQWPHVDSPGPGAAVSGP